MTATTYKLRIGINGSLIALGLAASAMAAEPPALPAPAAPPAASTEAVDVLAGEKRRTFRIERKDDGNRIIVLEMDALGDEVRVAVERAREHARDMREQALLHIDKAMLNSRRVVIDLDGRGLEAMERLEGAETRLRDAFSFVWEQSLTSELERLEREIAELGRELDGEFALDEEELEALRAEREHALEEAEQELEKAEKIRRRALADAAEQLRAAREQLREKRNQLREQLESRKN